MAFVDPGANALIEKLSARVAALEHQVQAIAKQLGIDASEAPAVPDGALAPGASAEVLALLRDGKALDAISAYRNHTGASLQGAKDEVDRLKAEHGL